MPPIKITKIIAMDSLISPLNKDIILPYNQNFLEFEFVALSFSNSQKNQFQYIMEGVDQRWVHAGRKHNANYTNLPPGDYIFKVIGCNSDGVWNKEGTSVKITIQPPWWGTKWFRLLLIFLLIGGGYGMFRYRLEQQLRLREAEIKASLMALETERQRFSRELHDGVGANLSLLKMYLSLFSNKEILMTDLKERSEKLLEGSIDEIRRLIYDMHPRNLKELGLTKSLHEIVKIINSGNDMQVSLQAQHIPDLLSDILEINLFRIVQELLHNAIKHSEAKNAWLNLEYNMALLTFTYLDDGRGFDISKSNQGHGLLNIRNRVSLLKGKITLSSSESQGTRVKIEVPIN